MLHSVRLVMVTDRRLMGATGADFGAAIARALERMPAGAALVQVREKDVSARELAVLVRAAIAAARTRGALVLVNDRVDVALACDADGVHLPERGLSIALARALLPRGSIVGASRHRAVDAAACDADLVVLGPIFATPSKAAFGAPLGVEAIDEVSAHARGTARLVAIGGIDSIERAALVRAHGADAVAAIRAIWSADDPARAAASLAGV